MGNETIYEESFFNNTNIPYCVKAGMVATLSGLSTNISKNTFGEDVFCALKFGNDKKIAGSVMFTFGAPESMGKNNCIASLKTFETSAIENVLNGLVDGKMKSDDDVCTHLAENVKSTLNLSDDGTKDYWNKIVAPNFDTYIKACQNNYNGMITENLANSLKETANSAFGKKKQIMQEM